MAQRSNYMSLDTYPGDPGYYERISLRALSRFLGRVASGVADRLRAVGDGLAYMHGSYSGPYAIGSSGYHESLGINTSYRQPALAHPVSTKLMRLLRG